MDKRKAKATRLLTPNQHDLIREVRRRLLVVSYSTVATHGHEGLHEREEDRLTTEQVRSISST